MTSQQIADELLRHWQLLWPLPPAERLERIDQLTMDYWYDAQLRAVEQEMAAA